MDPIETLSTLSTAVQELEAALSPILAIPLVELLANATDSLEKAKLDVTLAYVVHDLIWIYLKTVGVDPATHPVMEELGRVKEYFDKLKAAETKSTPRPQIDKAAANRFISAAIASGGSSQNAVAGPSGTHKRFDDTAIDVLLVDEEEVVLEKAAEDEVIVVGELDIEKKEKKVSRPKMDPFAGYDTPKSVKTKKSVEGKQGKRKAAETTATEGPTENAPTPPKKVKGKK